MIITPYHLTQNFDLKFVLVQVGISDLSKKQIAWNIDELNKICKKQLVGTLINQNQTLALNIQKGAILTVKTFGFAKQAFERINFGFVGKETDLHFESIDLKKVALVHQIDDERMVDCSFKVRLNYNIQNKLNDINDFFLMDDESILISHDGFISEIYKHLKDVCLFEGFETNIEYQTHIYELSLEKMNGNKIKQMPYNAKKGLFLDTDTKFNIETYKDELILIKGDPQPIKECSFIIIDTLESEKNKSWINVVELKKQLLEKKEFAIGQYFNIYISTGLYVVKLISGEKYSEDELEIVNKDLKKQSLCILNKESCINIVSESNLNLKFISDETAFNVSSLSFEVKLNEDLQVQINARVTQPKQISLLEIDLEEAIKKEITKPIIEGQVFGVKILNESFLLTAKNMTLQDKPEAQKFDSLGNITKETIFNFIKQPSSAISIIPKKGNLHAEKLIDALKEIGLGGIKDQLEQLIRRVVIFHDSGLKEDLDGYGLKPVKGMIFYGPPGTGKTTLARNFSKYLGCPQERIKLVSGPEIFNKWVGESEKNIRNLFEDAKLAQAKYGDKSPLFVIVLDEFDAIAAKRESGSAKWHNSVVDQLLAEIDGLSELNNILVIGITNRIDSLDPAIKRPGRFEFHLEIGLPDEAGRLEILEIYTRKLAKNKLAEDVDFKKLAKNTKGFSGADIEGLVRTAISYPLDRLYKNRNLEKEAKEKLLQLSKNDFNNALIEVKKNREKDKEGAGVPFGMYS